MDNRIITKNNYRRILRDVNHHEAQLKPEQQILINQKAMAQYKSLPTIWIIWLCFGIFGGHRYYMGDGKANSMLFLGILGFLTMLFFIGFALLLVDWIWKIVDACHLNQWIRIQHLTVRRKLVQQAVKD